VAAMLWQFIPGGDEDQCHLLVDFAGRLGSVSDIAGVKATVNARTEPSV